MYTEAPAPLNWPAAHGTDLDDVDPGGHVCPALQFPLHAIDDKPTSAPNLPDGHNPLQASDERPLVDPYLPAGQGVHTAARAKLNLPEGQMDAVPVVDPTGHANPAEHTPEQLLLTGRPVVENVPPPHNSSTTAVNPLYSLLSSE